MDVNEALNRLLMRIALRAEQSSPELLRQTFVEVEQITYGLLRVDHQIIYGRRGTGKTHAFSHSSLKIREGGDIPIYLDLRRIGSNGGLYSDPGLDLTQRATRLLIDVVEAVHTRLFNAVAEEERFDPLLNVLDDLADAATQLRVRGPVRVDTERELVLKADDEDGTSIDASVSAAPSLRLGITSRRKTSRAAKDRHSLQREGEELPHISFGHLGRALESVVKSISPARVYLLLDEWSSLPLDLQPVLADMLRRAFMSCPGFVVKIGAIERRSRFIQRRDAGTYLGLEVGADTAAALNIDEHLVMTEGGPKARAFIADLLYKHLTSLLGDFSLGVPITSPDRLTHVLFEDRAFSEFVRAAEGVPRDALNIAGLAAGIARNRRIGIAEIQSAARRYYLQDKESGITGNPPAQDLWGRLQKEVVSGRRSRIFLLRRNREQTHSGVLDLYDARLIHLLRQGLSTRNRPGTLYDGYAVDYGSYVSLLRESELDAAWEVNGQPWRFEERAVEPFLPDRFDEAYIFTPAKPRSSPDLRKKRGSSPR